MAANFPGTPTIGDTVTIENVTYRWTGTTWTIVSGRIVTAVVQSNNGTIDLSKGNYHKIAIDSGNATVTVSFTNVSSGSSKWFLELNVSASYTITWPASVIWEADTAPATTGSQTLILKFYTSDSGTNIYGVESINKDNTPVYSFQGSVSGYVSGGRSPDLTNAIESFSFSSDGNGSDVADLTVARQGAAGQSSTTHGYTSGGVDHTLSSYAAQALIIARTIDKFSFASNANATDVGDLSSEFGIENSAGQSSEVSGYISGGSYVSGSAPSPTIINKIDKFSFSTDANSTDVGDLTESRTDNPGGQSSSTHGYVSGGRQDLAPPTANYTNTIDKFPFSTDANATDVGDLTIARRFVAGQSSATSGYTSGGMVDDPAPGVADYAVNIIDKFPFASDSNATDVGDLTITSTLNRTGNSSTASGYTSGGYAPGSGSLNTIDKFPFAVDANATDVGDLAQPRRGSAGQQV